MRPAHAVLVFGFMLGGCTGSPDSVTPSSPGFATINTNIFEPNCTFACHSGGAYAAGGLDMKTAPYASLVGAKAAAAALCKGSPMLRVVPAQPEDSLVYVKVQAKIDGVAPPCGDGMPAGVDRPALSADDAETIRQWIEDGALDD